VNLLLVHANELDDGGLVTLADRRAEHALQVLRVSVGSPLKVGLIGGPLGRAEVVEQHANSLRIRCQFEEEVPPVPNDVLLLAMPRPKVFARCLEHATSLGFGRVVMFRSQRCVKSHFDSHVLESDQIQAHLLAGMEQARRTHLPEVKIFQRFRPFVEDALTSVITPTNHFLADPDAELALHQLHGGGITSGPFTVVIGPEGGLIPYETTAFTERGFRLVNAGSHPLRVEAAVSAIAAQLQLLRELSSA
jgi:RsmE family RNA methyltransferase